MIDVPNPSSSPLFNFTAGKVYAACFWLRSATPVPKGGVSLAVNLIEAQVYSWLAGGSTAVSTRWSRAYFANFKPSRNATAYVTLDVGSYSGTFLVDDFRLTSTPSRAEEYAAYVNSTNVAARIEAHRKGNFQLRFLNAAGVALAGARLASLRLRLVRHDFPFGTAMNAAVVPAGRLSWYQSVVKKHYNALVPEVSFKWPSYEPVQGQYLASYNLIINNLIKFATDNDFSGCANYREYLKTRITRDVGLFKGKFQSFDVFNEILHELQFVEGCAGMWPGILYDGFRWAAAADPTAQLCLNDYGLITGDDWQAMVTLVKAMLAAKVPINCIGVQPRFDALAALNLTLLVTEFNFYTYWGSEGPVWEGSGEEHAALYDEYIRYWFSLPYIKGMLMWGFWDSLNWIKNGGVYYANGTAKASATKLSSLWGSVWNTTLAASNVGLSDTGVYGPYRGFYGKYEYEIKHGSKQYTGYAEFPAKSGAAQTVTVTLR
ncbi:putative endo-1,4-beta-xylanase C [Tetrabaena socialis]|uniref:Putative endo-1,4-beta-xylanase C n=1 Tax=Tetrabaena socialis TaxID=47790 RepID=A0A2J8A2P2_9CHLO|nr:putative endo-1,4-beta-xylanase C [Tetrabaena socialis]|eukprot:PNH06784.1 putative endo-1,4-beta-xylanase C [Tetrabaena socialis]